MSDNNRRDLTHDLVLPVLLFAALGGMTWAVRGCSGFGGSSGCIFAGVMWGAAWWFIARDPSAQQSRRYTSGWIILALTIGIGLSGARGWMQWRTFFDGQLQTNYQAGEFVPISEAYGFLWLFIAGVPWAGIGACMLAWCGADRPTGIFRHLGRWALRIACGVGAVFLARYLFDHYPQVFLPLYNSMKERYADLQTNPNLGRLINDCRAAIMHLGLYLGLLVCEVIRRDRKNVTLILTVGLVNGLGWALLQNWQWADEIWSETDFNWWRCWESSGGISIGIAYGIAYYLVNRRMSEQETMSYGAELASTRPKRERLGAYLGLMVGLGLSLKNGLKGWANIYLENEDYWDRLLWDIIGPSMLVCLVLVAVWILFRPVRRGSQGDVFPHAYRLVWLVLIMQNIIAQLVTGPPTAWNEMVFNIYYVLLFIISAAIVVHFHCVKALRSCQAG
jgi:hypothetical protein